MSKTLLIERRGAVEWLRLHRPDSLNALNSELLDALKGAFEAASNDPEVRAIVLAGSGRAFCAGGDLKATLSALEAPVQGGPDAIDKGAETITAVRACPKPVIAAVNGAALAGGLELVLSCDVVFAAQGVQMGDAHSNFGLLPGGGGAALLPRRIGLNRAKGLLFSGDFLPVETFHAWGLVYAVVPADELEQAVDAFARKLEKKSPLVLRSMKAVANASLDSSEEMALAHELLALRNHMRTQDFREGLQSFTERREPQFAGK